MTCHALTTELPARTPAIHQRKSVSGSEAFRVFEILIHDNMRVSRIYFHGLNNDRNYNHLMSDHNMTTSSKVENREIENWRDF